MAVCKLAIISYSQNEDIGGYSIFDLQDCIAMARWNKECGLDHIAYVRVENFDHFIKWAKHRIKIMKRGNDHVRTMGNDAGIDLRR